MIDKVIAETRFLNLIDREGWYFATRPNSRGVVAIVAVTDKDELLLVQQFRVPLNAMVVELPAGLAGDVPGHEGEPLELAAQRELEEETGYRCARMRLLVKGPSSAGLTDEVVWLYLAEDLERIGKGGGDEHEEIVVHRVPLQEVDAWLDRKQEEGCWVDYKIFAGLRFWQQASEAKS